MPDPNVNVIFHGLFLFIERKASVDVVIPNMGQDHIYQAGNFLVEETLAARPLRSPYFLSGVVGGNARLDDQQNIVFQKHTCDALAPPEDVYARIVLPIPMEILSLRPTEQAYQADVDPQGLMNNRTTCGVQVLRYFAPDLAQVRLDGHTAKLGAHPPTGPKFVNLHIISEEDFVATADHPRQGFDRTLHLIPGLRGTIHFSNSTRLKSEPDNHRAQGFHAIETFDTRERIQFLLQAGLDWREDTPNLPGTALVVEPPFDCVPLYCREDY
jgi:hypothetical protein